MHTAQKSSTGKKYNLNSRGEGRTEKKLIFSNIKIPKENFPPNGSESFHQHKFTFEFYFVVYRVGTQQQQGRSQKSLRILLFFIILLLFCGAYARRRHKANEKEQKKIFFFHFYEKKRPKIIKKEFFFCWLLVCCIFILLFRVFLLLFVLNDAVRGAFGAKLDCWVGKNSCARLTWWIWVNDGFLGSLWIQAFRKNTKVMEKFRLLNQKFWSKNSNFEE